MDSMEAKVFGSGTDKAARWEELNPKPNKEEMDLILKGPINSRARMPATIVRHYSRWLQNIIHRMRGFL